MRISAVSYLNTKPFLYGLEHSGLVQGLDIQQDIPALCAQKLLTAQADIGLVPVAILPELPEAEVIGAYCIGAVGAVKTVCLYSQVPIERIERVFLDYQSRTSVRLAQVLLKNHWGVSPSFCAGYAGFEPQMRGTDAAVVIGDRTIGLESHYAYVYDLAEAWLHYTGLPFVFAAWVSRVPLSAQFLADFNAALAWGLERRAAVAAQWQKPYDALGFSVQEYYERYISYALDAPKRAGLERFLGYLRAEEGAALF